MRAGSVRTLAQFDAALDNFYKTEWRHAYLCCMKAIHELCDQKDQLVARHAAGDKEALAELQALMPPYVCKECGIVWESLRGPWKQEPPWTTA